MPFQCTIITPEHQALDESASQVILPAHDGLMGILTDRSPLLVRLGVGPLRVDLAAGQQRHFLIDGGIAQMKDNKLTILTTLARPASELDAQTARAQYEAALAAKPNDAQSAADRQRQIQRARAAEALVGKS